MPRRRSGWRGPTDENPTAFPSLGWDLRDLFEDYLIVPAGPDYGKPLRLTPEQEAFLVKLYRVDPKTGRRVYRRAVLRRSKGWGKSPFCAAWAFGELVGDVVFAGWSADGEPVGKPRATPWIQLAAVAEDQTSNTFAPLFSMLENSDAVDDFGIDLGKTRIELWNRPGRIERVTSEAGTREGQPITAAVLDQTETWLPNNGGVLLAGTLRRNAAKNQAQTVETPNAHVPGDGSVAEATERAAARRGGGILYDHREAPPVEDLTDRSALLAALRVAYGDAAAWVDLERIVDEIQDPDTSASEGRRWWLNQAQAREEQVVPIETWRALAVVAALESGDQVALGFDGSVTRNATVLVAIRYPDCVAFPLGVWEPPADLPVGERWEVPRAEVHGVVDWAMSTLKVRRFYMDPPEWRDALDSWRERYGDDRVAQFVTSQDRKMAPACDRFVTMVAAGGLHHNGHPVFERHLANARRHNVGARVPQGQPQPWIVAEKAKNYPIDAVTALVVGLSAYGDALAAGKFSTQETEPWMARA